MRARTISSTEFDRLMDPSAATWKQAGAERVKLEGSPLGMQPTALIRAAWQDRKIGAIDRVQIAALHDGERLAFRLEWSDPTENRGNADNVDFPDGVAVLLPAVQGAPIVTMGAPGNAVNAWYWRADDDTNVRHVVAEGIGTSRTVSVEAGLARGAWKEGRWQVVIARALRVETVDPVAQLQAGETTGIGVAIWDGGSGERAGIKSISGLQWRKLSLDALPTARR
ncbi:MAG: hypothetical protein JRH01_01265 [Deltaproteobacteria bacterium]|nr:hypothetical protein [Deltaproteobacteria bacterium]MBW2393139.1 hypothetical protein [Deltaproteobacteria bacterium]